MGVACNDTCCFSRPVRRRSIQKTVFLSSCSRTKASWTCNSCERRTKAKASSGLDGMFSISDAIRISACRSPMNSSPFSSRNSRRFSNAKLPSPPGSKEKKNADGSRKLLMAPESGRSVSVSTLQKTFNIPSQFFASRRADVKFRSSFRPHLRVHAPRRR